MVEPVRPERGKPSATPAAATSSPSAPSLEDVRRELRSLGYLRGPISGLILPVSSARATFLRVTLLTSLRAGVLGALILVAPLTLAMGRLLAPHVHGWNDHAILALYFAPLLASALFVLNILGDLAIRALSRGRGAAPGRGERIAARLAAGLAALSSLYLATVWGRPGPGAGAGLISIAPALVLIATAGVVVGWLVRSGGLIVIAALGGRLERAERTRGSGRIIVAAAALGVAALAATVVLRPARPEPRPMPPITAAPVPGRLIVLGVDGLDSEWLSTLLDRTAAPALSRVRDRSLRYALDPYRCDVPPEVWTTIATGVEGEVHGVRSFEVYRLPGLRSPLAAEAAAAPAARATLGAALRFFALLQPESSRAAPLSSVLRRTRAVWEVMQAGGFPAAVVNWWGTWPAQAEGVTVVSDRAFGSFLSASANEGDLTSGPKEGEALVQPPALLNELRSGFGGTLDRLRSRFEVDRAGGDDPLARAAEGAYLIDSWHLEVAELLLTSRPVRALFVYLPGQDIVLGGLSGERRGAGLERTLETIGAQERLFRELDRGVAGILDSMTSEDLLVLVADPGRYFRREGSGSPRGSVWLYGDRVRPGDGGEGSELDLAPTFLALAGVPISSELPGHVLPGIDSRIDRLPVVGRITDFGDRAAVLSEGMESDPEVLERLRSLGYIQ